VYALIVTCKSANLPVRQSSIDNERVHEFNS
jgi:hypothetical protein